MVWLGPLVLLLGLGVLSPGWGMFFGGAALGWIVVVYFVLRGRVRMKYQAAIRCLRRGEYSQAVAEMDALIQEEPDVPEHRRFRAELYRLSGAPQKAAADYEHLARLTPDSAEGCIGLAEVYAQQGEFGRARRYAQQALEREPRRWLPAYTLGMIEDRLGDAASAVKHLEQAWDAGIPHSRHRLLVRLWLARNTYRLGHPDAAQQHIDRMREQVEGLRDWQLVFESEQAAALRALLEDDVHLAQQLLDSQAPLEMLGGA